MDDSDAFVKCWIEKNTKNAEKDGIAESPLR